MLAMGEFVNAACAAVFLLNRRHMPYYKWQFRALGELEKLGELREPLEFLLTGENDSAGQKLKAELVEDICAQVVEELRAQGLSCGSWDYLEPHALDFDGTYREPPDKGSPRDGGIEMEIQWLGHACFKITHKGYSVVIDPYDSDYTTGYPKLKVKADKLLISHEHYGHNYRKGVELSGRPDRDCPFEISVLETWNRYTYRSCGARPSYISWRPTG